MIKRSCQMGKIKHLKCKSEVLLEEWDDKFSILFFKYECELCGHKWNNLKKQIQFTLKLLKERRNNMQINRKVCKSEASRR